MTTPELELDLRASIRTIPDYPSPGIMFRDITTLLGNARAFRRAVDELVQPWAGSKIDKVAGMEARGFILGGAVAHQCSAGFVPIRKKGKLPYKRVSIGYSLEYGVDEMEMHEDGVAIGERVVLVDDLVATGGTAEAAVKLLRKIGAEALGDLATPPGNMLEALKGDLRGKHSIRINDQWRIVFRWTDAGPEDVEIADYH